MNSVHRNCEFGGGRVVAAMAASFSCAAAAAWRVNDLQILEKQNMLALTKRYGRLRTSPIRSIPLGSSVSRSPRRQTWEWLGRPCAVRLEGSSTAETTKTKKKIAKLFVQKNQTVPLPTFSDPSGKPKHLSAFLREPEGRQCMLNTKSLRKYQEVDDGVFLCYLPMMEFLSFEVAPVLELMVDAREDSCVVNMLSCKFEGSDLVRSQNKRFSASLRNHLSWSSTEEVESLHIRIDLDVSLEVYTLPFTVLPISAVESPGTVILQALVDRLIPRFVDQLFVDYQAWAEAQSFTSRRDEESPGGVEERQSGD